MKALSVRQPFASLIVTGLKTIEWRLWQVKYRGDLLICAGATPADIYYEFDQQQAREKWPLGVAVGIISVVDCRAFQSNDLEAAYMEECPSDPIGYAWVLENPREIKPFPVKGKLNFFNVEYPVI